MSYEIADHLLTEWYLTPAPHPIPRHQPPDEEDPVKDSLTKLIELMREAADDAMNDSDGPW